LHTGLYDNFETVLTILTDVLADVKLSVKGTVSRDFRPLVLGRDSWAKAVSDIRTIRKSRGLNDTA
jgi:hypothetical protein